MISSSVTYSTQSFPQAVAAIDFNNDSLIDVIIINRGSNSISIYYNTGNGTLSAPQSYSTGSGPRTLTVKDVNNDSRPDIIVASLTSNDLSIHINAGNGSLLSRVIHPLSTGATGSSLVAGDLNGDNIPDLVLANFELQNVGVFINAGNGTFLSEVNYSVDIRPLSAAVGDINGDHMMDIVVANQYSHTVSILLNAGNGTFLPKLTLTMVSGAGPSTVLVHDMNQDGYNDIIVVTSDIHAIFIFFNTGNSTFLSSISYSTGSNSLPIGLTINDMNGDNIPDLISAYYDANRIGIFLNYGNKTFSSPATHITGTNPYSLAAADLNGDQSPDFIVANYYGNDMNVFLSSC